MTDDSGQSSGGIARIYNCVRCRKDFCFEYEVLRHIETEHEGESDGKYDYVVNITEEFP